MKPLDRDVRIFNTQRARPIDREAVERAVTVALDAAGFGAELAIHFISARRSALLNERHLQHQGPTDILTFDHGSTPARLSGELFICVAEAVRQAAEFKTNWQAELVRYVIHGILHLSGYDDRDPGRRRVMKREENRLVALCVMVRRPRPAAGGRSVPKARTRRIASRP